MFYFSDTSNLDLLHRALCVPEQPVNPPEPTPDEYDRNIRNSCRLEAIEALGTAISRLDEIDWNIRAQNYLENLCAELRNEME